MTNPGEPKLIIDGDWKKDHQASKPAAPAPAATPPGASIAVDADWKNQAQAEKARLAAAEEQKRASEPARSAGGRDGLPPADFNGLLGTLVSQALMYLGAFPDEMGRAVVSLEHARFHIDLIQVLADKTKGNISPEESSELAQVVNELRVRFVEISQAVARAAAKRQQGGGGPGAGMGAGGPGGPLVM
jgi:hypothetical protein